MNVGGIMKKISILSLHLGYGGVEKSIAALANVLCKNYEVEIICIYQLYEKPAFTIDERVKITYLIHSDLPVRVEKYKLLLFRRQFTKLLKQLTTDYFSKFKFVSFFKDGISGLRMYSKRFSETKKAIISSDADIMISTRTFLNEWASLYGNDNMIKIGWEHNHHHNNEKYANQVIESSKALDYLVLVSKDLKNYYEKRLKDNKCECVYIPNMIENIPERKSTLKKPNMISVGRLSVEKGYIDLLKIFNQIAKKYNDWHLDIIGDGDEREKLEKYIQDKKLQNQVTLHGFQSKDYIDKMLHQSSIYLMTSYTESFGIVLLEAMSHGLPCIAFDSAEGAREIIKDGESGWLIKNRDFDKYERAISTLIENQNMRKKMGKSGALLVNMYSKDVVMEMWFHLLEGKEV